MSLPPGQNIIVYPEFAQIQQGLSIERVPLVDGVEKGSILLRDERGPLAYMIEAKSLSDEWEAEPSPVYVTVVKKDRTYAGELVSRAGRLITLKMKSGETEVVTEINGYDTISRSGPIPEKRDVLNIIRRESKGESKSIREDVPKYLLYTTMRGISWSPYIKVVMNSKTSFLTLTLTANIRAHVDISGNLLLVYSKDINLESGYEYSQMKMAPRMLAESLPTASYSPSSVKEKALTDPIFYSLGAVTLHKTKGDGINSFPVIPEVEILPRKLYFIYLREGGKDDETYPASYSYRFVTKHALPDSRVDVYTGIGEEVVLSGRTKISSKVPGDDVDLDLGETYTVSSKCVITRTPIESKDVLKTVESKIPIEETSFYKPSHDMIVIDRKRVERVNIEAEINNSNKEDINIIIRFPHSYGAIKNPSCEYKLKNNYIEFEGIIEAEKKIVFKCSYEVEMIR